MNRELYVVTGATGHIGRQLTEVLLAQGKIVRAVARNAERLKKLASKGADIYVGDVEKVGDMIRAFRGAKAVFCMIPPHNRSENFRLYQNGISETYREAITAAGVGYVVNLSSIGAHRPDRLGLINGLYDHEQRLNKITGVHVYHLRPGFFMENHLGSMDLIRQKGINGSALQKDLAFPMIATTDIAAVAAEHLLKLDFSGKSVRELLGPRDLTMQEVTRILGQTIGKPDLSYVQFSYEDTEKALGAAGFSANVARLYVEMLRGFNEGLAKPTQGRTRETITPTTFEEFSKQFAQAYANSGQLTTLSGR